MPIVAGTSHRPVSIASTKLSSTSIANCSGVAASNEEEEEQVEPSGLADAAESYGPPATPGLQRALEQGHARSARTSNTRYRGRIPRSSLWHRVWRRARRVFRAMRPAPPSHDEQQLPSTAATMNADTGGELVAKAPPPTPASHGGKRPYEQQGSVAMEAAVGQKPPRSRKDPFKQPGSVAIVTKDGRELPPLAAVIQFDTLCEPGNLISTSFLEKAKMNNTGRAYDTSAGVDIGVSINGRACKSLGTVIVRWWSEDFDMDPRFEDATCHIVNSDKFEFIIGKPDIIRLELFQLNRKPIGCINALFAPRPTVEGSSNPLIFKHISDSSEIVKSVPQQNDLARAAKALERKEQERLEKEEEEKARHGKK
jgi:hypothetical protein